MNPSSAMALVSAGVMSAARADVNGQDASNTIVYPRAFSSVVFMNVYLRSSEWMGQWPANALALQRRRSAGRCKRWLGGFSSNGLDEAEQLGFRGLQRTLLSVLQITE